MRLTKRAEVIQRFERRERSRSQMRFFELSSLAGIYAKARCGGDIDAGYREIVKALDHVGFLGSRVLYLDSDIQPPYFPQPRKRKEEKLKWLPHKTNPIITKQFIENREKELGWPIVRDAYLAKGWTNSLPAAQWLQSKGITPPNSIDWSLKACEEKTAAPIEKLIKPIPKRGARRAARLALDQLYPQGIPLDKSGEELLRAVNRHIQRRPSDLIEGRVKQTVSLDTVLRAAERKE